MVFDKNPEALEKPENKAPEIKLDEIPDVKVSETTFNEIPEIKSSEVTLNVEDKSVDNGANEDWTVIYNIFMNILNLNY